MIKQKPIGSFVLYIYFLYEKIRRPQEKILCVPNQIALLLTYPGPQMRTCNNALNAVRFLYQLIIFYCRLSTTSETRAKIHGENVALWTRASPLTLFNASPMHTVFFFFLFQSQHFRHHRDVVVPERESARDRDLGAVCIFSLVLRNALPLPKDPWSVADSWTSWIHGVATISTSRAILFVK